MQINGYRTLTDALNGTHTTSALGACNKMFWSEAHQETMLLAMDIYGLEGQILQGDEKGDTLLPGARRAKASYPVNNLQSLFFFSRSETIWGGAAEIQRNIVGERVLGLPKGADPNSAQRAQSRGAGRSGAGGGRQSPPPGVTLDPGPAALNFSIFARRKAATETSHGTAGPTLEGLEHGLLLGVGDAAAPVLDSQEDAVVVAGQHDLDGRALGRVTQGVAHEVVDDACRQLGIELDPSPRPRGG